ncbi:MAG: hypothetical protein ACRETL_04710, partial [Gammaproteobacteria bacterium]
REIAELTRRLTHIAAVAGGPSGQVYIEMLFDMRFDGMPPADGRIAITPQEFEGSLTDCFPAEEWVIERTYGPIRQSQSFASGMRSFLAPSRSIDSTVAEYLLRRIA